MPLDHVRPSIFGLKIDHKKGAFLGTPVPRARIAVNQHAPCHDIMPTVNFQHLQQWEWLPLILTHFLYFLYFFAPKDLSTKNLIPSLHLIYYFRAVCRGEKDCNGQKKHTQRKIISMYYYFFKEKERAQRYIVTWLCIWSCYSSSFLVEVLERHPCGQNIFLLTPTLFLLQNVQ